MRERLNDIMRPVERSLWRHRALILTLGCGVLVLRFWTTRSTTVIDATYPVAEMLINYSDGFVRRGLSGDMILTLSQTFGGAPSIWAGGILCLLGVTVFVMSISIYARLPDVPPLLPVVLAPWGLMSLVYDPDLLVRKEVFGYLALGAILLGTLSTNQRRAMFGLIFGCATMPIAIVLHEVNASLAGALLIAAVMFLRAHPDRRDAIYAWVTFSVCTSVVSFGAVAVHTTADPRVMCDAVLFAECEAPFMYFSETAANGTALIMASMGRLDSATAIALVVLSSLPFWGFRLPHQHSALLMAVAAVIAVPVLPLFAVAVDYGRWITLIFLPASLLAATALIHGWIIHRAILPSILTVLYCSTWSFYHWGVVPQLYALWLWPMLGVAIAISRMFERTNSKPAKRKTAP